jgi:hypothetical protein
VRWIWTILSLLAVAGILSLPETGEAADFVVYSVYKNIDLGNADEVPQRDFYVNMGAVQGVRKGMSLDVYRKTSTYDLMTEKLYKDLVFPIARLRVIHVESTAAVARLDSLLPADQTPAYSPRAVMVGDLVRVAH